MSIIQHGSTVATNSTISVTLPGVTKGNLIVIGVTEYGGETLDLKPAMLSDNQGNTYLLAGQQEHSAQGNIFIAGIFYAVAKASGSLTVTFTDLLGLTDALHVYE